MTCRHHSRAQVAYGDLATAVLALLALAMLSSKMSAAPIWLFNIVGAVDLLNAYYQGNRISIANAPGEMGAAYSFRRWLCRFCW